MSACLAGVACRHDGRHSLNQDVLRLLGEGKALPACPAQLGGLPTPRPAAELRGGDGRAVLTGEASVSDRSGEVLTDRYLKGAIEFCRLAKKWGGVGAVLRDRSPSCATGRLCIDGRLRGGRGVAAALLEAEGFALLSPAGLRKLISERGGRSR